MSMGRGFSKRRAVRVPGSLYGNGWSWGTSMRRWTIAQNVDGSSWTKAMLVGKLGWEDGDETLLWLEEVMKEIGVVEDGSNL
ncbi:hypothetical protein U1Q18_016720, partial [Sarracenia purpurea var. burkii]